MATVGKKHTTQRTKHESLQPELETGFDLPVSGIPGNEADMAGMLGRDGKWLCGGELPCYATGRADRQAPPFPGVRGNLRGTSGNRE